MTYFGKMHTISVLVEGRKRYLKVTKTTTCDDVIQHLLNYNGLKENDEDYYLLIVSKDGTEKQLSKNANILNIALNLMSETTRIYFIMRKKTRLFVPKISIAKCRRLRDKSLTKEQKVEKVPSTRLDTSKCAPSMKTSEPVRGVKRLYQLVRVQKRRLSEVYQKLNGTAKFFKQIIRKKTIHSDELDTSLDQFQKDVNQENMQGLCDVKATTEMGNLSSILPPVPSIDHSVMNGHLRFMPHTWESPRVDYTSKIPLVNDSSLSELNSAFEDATNDVPMLDDDLYHRGEGEKSFGTMASPYSRKRTVAARNRMKRNNTPLHSTPLAKKAMTYLNKSTKPTIMVRQFGNSRLPQDRLTSLTPKEMPIYDSCLNRRPDGDLSMFIWHERSAFSSQKDKCKYFWEQSYGSDSDDSLDKTRLDKKHDDAVLSNIDDNRKVSADSVSSFNVISRKLANDRDHLVLKFDGSPREFPREHHDEEKDDLMKSNLKMRLVNYSLSDGDISLMSCESVGMSCDCKKISCATFSRDYVTRFGYSPESA